MNSTAEERRTLASTFANDPSDFLDDKLYTEDEWHRHFVGATSWRRVGSRMWSLARFFLLTSLAFEPLILMIALVHHYGLIPDLFPKVDPVMWTTLGVGLTFLMGLRGNYALERYTTTHRRFVLSLEQFVHLTAIFNSFFIRTFKSPADASIQLPTAQYKSIPLAEWKLADQQLPTMLVTSPSQAEELAYSTIAAAAASVSTSTPTASSSSTATRRQRYARRGMQSSLEIKQRRAIDILYELRELMTIYPEVLRNHYSSAVGKRSDMIRLGREDPFVALSSCLKAELLALCHNGSTATTGLVTMVMRRFAILLEKECFPPYTGPVITRTFGMIYDHNGWMTGARRTILPQLYRYLLLTILSAYLLLLPILLWDLYHWASLAAYPIIGSSLFGIWSLADEVQNKYFGEDEQVFLGVNTTLWVQQSRDTIDANFQYLFDELQLIEDNFVQQQQTTSNKQSA